MSRQKIFNRVTTLMLAVIMLTSLLFAQTAASNKGTTGPATAESLISEYEGDLNYDVSSYFDSSRVLSLPQGYTEEDEVSIIVALSIESVLESYDRRQSKMDIGAYAAAGAGKAAREKIDEAKSDILDKLEQAQLSYSMGYEYSLLLSGFEVRIKARDYGLLCEAVGNSADLIVSELYETADAEEDPTTGSQVVENDVNVYDTGIFNSSGLVDSDGTPIDGRGTVVAVLDTGFDYTHSAYSLANFESTDLVMPSSAVSNVLRDTNAFRTTEGLTPQDVYLNDKIPFAYDYADQDADVYPIESEHGTHVAAIIGGKNDVITGVAPNCQLVLMKVFSDTKTGAYTSWILSALEDCVTLGVDVINMSLGTAAGFTQEEDDKQYIQDIYDSIAERGISLVAAASNDYNSTYGSVKNGNLGLTSNPDTATVGSPSTYEAALSVASISGVKTPYMTFNGQILYFTEASDASSQPKDFVEEILSASETSRTFEYVTIPGVGRSADYSGLDVKGKIALVRRGDNTFEEKALIAERQGAAGVIIYNNVSGDITMTVGMADIPVCSISQDDGEILAAQSSGQLVVSRDQVAGPFISNFSSWGPTPDLRIKPEITAHGGEIYSAVPGEDYDRLSGTSMASPNQAGVTALIRQYVKEHFAAQTGGDAKAVAAMVNQIMMSTTDIALNTNGLPYSVRRQGSGLANLTKATNTPAYITTFDKEGNLMNKAKLEVGDDPSKSGVYSMTLAINNVKGTSSLTYDVGAIVMTEGVSDTLTDHQETTVTEQGYLLEGASIKVEGNGVSGTSVTVGVGQSVTVTVTITLSDADKAYLDESFANGMYVEGFITLTPTSGTDISLNVPYLAFYGDWTQAPLFDLDYFETDADEMDDSILPEDKTMADAYATRPVGGLYLDYINYLGSYAFVQDPSTPQIAASRDHIALSNQDDACNSIYGIWAGMLRGGKRMELTITDDVTGEVVYSQTDFNQRKSYNYGGGIIYSSLDVDFRLADYNLKNNTQYTVNLTGYLDYGEDGGLSTNKRNTFEFTFVTDFEAPALTDVEFYTEYDRTEQRTRLYARMHIYDNHYAMATQVGRVYLNEQERSIYLEGFGKYMTPVNSSRNSTSVITFELTDYMEQIRTSYNRETQTNEGANSFVVICYDYALNQAVYEVRLPDYIEQMYFEETDITLSPNELVNLEPMLWPSETWAATLAYSSSDEGVARVVNGRLVGVSSGDAVITVTATGANRAQTTFNVHVLGPDEEGYVSYSKPVADDFRLTGYYVDKAFYFVNSSDREIGVEDTTGSFGNSYNLSMFPSEAVTLQYQLDAYFPEDTEVIFESGNDAVVTVDENGKVTAVAEGSSVVSVRVMMDGRSTYYSQNVSITVKDPYVTNGMYLMSYSGNGGVVDVGKDLPNLSMTEVYQYAFSGYEYVEKDPEDITEEDPSTMEPSYLGNDEITKIILPEGFEVIGAYAFAGLTALEEVVLPSTLTKIQQGAFEGCTSLRTVTGLEHVKFVNQNAFKDCVIENADFSSMVAIGNYAFENNVLQSVTLPATAQSIGIGAFRNNGSMSSLTIEADQVKLGSEAFANCSSLVSVDVNAAVIPSGVFDGCDMLVNVALGPDVAVVGAYAFRGTQVSRFSVDDANPNLSTAANDSYLLSEDGTTLILAAPYRAFGTVQASELPNVTTISTGAFAGIENLTAVYLPNVTKVGDYAFAGSRVSTVRLGQLTEVGDYAFYQTAISVLPDLGQVSSVGNYAFAGTLITEVTLPDNITVGDYAFADCDLLSRVSGGNNVTIGASAFRNNAALSQVTLGDNAYLGAYAFAAVRERIDYQQVSGLGTLYFYGYTSKLTSITLGDNAYIGNAAFIGAGMDMTVSQTPELTLTLGDGARIGAEAFSFGTTGLRTLDLSGVVEIGESAFATNFPMLIDLNGETLIYGYLVLTPSITELDLSSLETLGANAFADFRNLTSVTLGDGLTEIGAYAFQNCHSLANINLNNVLVIGERAFENTALTVLDLSSVDVIGDYAFAFSLVESEDGSTPYFDPTLTAVTFKEGASVGDYAFYRQAALTELNNLDKVSAIGDLAFAYSAVTEVSLGESLTELGENPFLACDIAPFTTTEDVEFNGQVVGTTEVDTYDISDTVKVIGGALYRVAPNGGYELITYPQGAGTAYTVAEDTVRIGAYAFAETGIVQVTLPVSLKAIGHKAFYGCDSLNIVIFQSYNAPILEEEYDASYVSGDNLYNNLPLTGDFQVNAITTYPGLGIVPYYMWNITSLYSNFYFGANFVDYIGHFDGDLIIVRPSNGNYYDTFIYGQYFGTEIAGTAAPEQATLDVISTIADLPDAINVTLAHEDAVVAARAAYDALSQLQQTLVTNYDRLTAAENTIAYLKGNQEPTGPDIPVTPDEPDFNYIPVVIVLAVAAGLFLAGTVTFGILYFRKRA